MKKLIEFQETTKGHIALIDGQIAWFIRQENDNWKVYRSEDGGKGFKLIPPISIAESTNSRIWGHETLVDAKKFISRRELCV